MSKRRYFLGFGRRHNQSASASAQQTDEPPLSHTPEEQNNPPQIPSTYTPDIPNSTGPDGQHSHPRPISPQKRDNTRPPLAVITGPQLHSTTNEPGYSDVDALGAGQVRGSSSFLGRAADLTLRLTHSHTSFGQSSRADGPPSTHKFPGPLGLTVIYEPASRNLDLVFVHGLGGGSRRTWCYDRKPELFWPEWLRDIPGLDGARISTFGYNADIFTNSGVTDANTGTFAKDLLHCLSIQGQRHEAYGRVPIIFICHSMGGLVVKRACIKASNDGDKRIREISAKISGIIFLGTPHRGSSHAKFLDNLVFLLGRGGAGRAYLKDLKSNSGLLLLVNDEFRHLVPRIQLFSFFEMKKTRVGTFEQLIVEQSSATLGYREEGTAPLPADHHLICKFFSPEDPNFDIVTRTILSMVEKIFAEDQTITPALGDRKQDRQEIYQFLLSPDHTSTEADFYTIRSKRLEGSCQWLTQQAWFIRWRQGGADTKSEILWLNGLPGTGKSVIASFLIDQLKNIGHSCYYYFFKSSDASKRGLERCLLNIAYKISLEETAVRDKLRRLHESKFNLVDAELLLLWQKIYVSGILPIFQQKRLSLFLIIDALDEAENSMAIFHIFNTLRAIPNLRLCVTSRPSVQFAQQLSLLNTEVKVNQYTITQKDNIDDISFLVKTKLAGLPLSGEVRTQIVESVIQKAEGNILWVSLVSEQMARAGFNQENLLRMLEQVPPGMDRIYADILAKLRAVSDKGQRDIARWIILWTLSAIQPLPVSTLQEALEFNPPAEKIQSLEYWVANLCGSFLVIDENKSVQPIHTTAREFLTTIYDRDQTNEYAITPTTHLHIARVCLETMLRANNSGFRKQSVATVSGSTFDNYLIGTQGIHGYTLWRYAVFWWSSHLISASVNDVAMFDLVIKVLRSTAFMGCIREIAESGDLDPFVRMAKNLKQYINNLRIDEMENRKENVKYLSLWTVDLIRLTTEFGENLLKFPSLTETIIAPFCPRSSAIYQQFGARKRGIALLGDVPKNWNTRLASLSTPQASRSPATRVCAASKLVAVGYQNGLIAIWNPTTAFLVYQLNFAESISCLTFNQTGSCIAAGGRSRITLWNASTASEQLTIPIADDPILITFSPDGLLLVIFRNNKLKAYTEDGMVFSEFDWAEETSTNVVATSPLCVSLNFQGTRMAVAYRGLPISIWDIAEKVYLTKLTLAGRTSSHRKAYEHGQQGFSTYIHDSASTLEYHSREDEIFISFADRTFVKWNPDTNEQIISPLQADIHAMKCSPDGTMIVTGNSHGHLKLWSTTTLELLFTVEEDDEGIQRLCFSPDGSRIFDVRRAYCNVWEPEILLRGARIYRETKTPPPIHPNEHSDSTDLTNAALSVKCLCPSPNGKFFIAGTDNGLVILYSLSSGNKLKLLYTHGSSAAITSMTWSKDGSLVATGDNTSKVFVHQLSISSAHGPTNMAAEMSQLQPTEDERGIDYEGTNSQVFESSLTITTTQLLKGVVKVGGRLDGFITSLLIAEGNNLLMASTLNAESVWRLNINATPPPTKKSSKPVGSCLTICYSSAQKRHILQHPDDRDLILVVDPQFIRSCSWSSVQQAIVDNQGDQSNVCVKCDTLTGNITAVRSKAKSSLDHEPYELEGTSLSRAGGGNGSILAMSISKPQAGREMEIWVCKLNEITSDSDIIYPFMYLGISIRTPAIKALLGVFRQKIYFLDMRGWVCSINITLEELNGNNSPPRDELREFTMWFFLPRGHITPAMSSTTSHTVVWNWDVIFTRKNSVIIVKRGLSGQGMRITKGL